MVKELGVTEVKSEWWRNYYGRLTAEDAKKLKALAKGNLKLNKLLAEA